MTNTSAIPITVDGIRLDTYAYNVAGLEGRLHVPGVRGANPVVPGRHGSLYVPDKTFEDNEFVLNMWVIGADVNGGIPTTDMTEFRKNIEAATIAPLARRRQPGGRRGGACWR